MDKDGSSSKVSISSVRKTMNSKGQSDTRLNLSWQCQVGCKPQGWGNLGKKKEVGKGRT